MMLVCWMVVVRFGIVWVFRFLFISCLVSVSVCLGCCV